MSKDKMVTITENKYDRLLAESRKLNALECYGVDNWDGYDYAMSEYFGEDEEEDE